LKSSVKIIVLGSGDSKLMNYLPDISAVLWKK